MAAISSISNGEALSSVRTKLNSVITEINILDPTDWIDYSATSTIVGWSSFTTKQIRYRIIGKQMFVVYKIFGTSISTTTSFTLPNNCINIGAFNPNYGVDNGAIKNFTYSEAIVGSNNIFFWQTGSYTWTASGAKQIIGQFFIEIA